MNALPDKEFRTIAEALRVQNEAIIEICELLTLAEGLPAKRARAIKERIAKLTADCEAERV